MGASVRKAHSQTLPIIRFSTAVRRHLSEVSGPPSQQSKYLRPWTQHCLSLTLYIFCSYSIPMPCDRRHLAAAPRSFPNGICGMEVSTACTLPRLRAPYRNERVILCISGCARVRFCEQRVTRIRYLCP